MIDARRKNVEWTVSSDESPSVTFAGAQLAVLMDIRDELQELNLRLRATLGCSNFLRIPRDVRQIRLNTNKPKRRKKQ